ncbi:MAG: 7-carboxy-7-deazaguanine synthase QueE [Bacteroidia bacterium]|nr:7-carboxy-7-deazaguanine synthase QueE [Bacteroidia bacterium]
MDLTKTKLPLMEEFFSIQGEGWNTGKQAYFVRLAGCDVGCVWCDVKESWNRNDHSEEKISNILNNIAKNESQNVVVTGGEPLMHDLDLLCSSLKDRGLNIWLETSGAYPLSGEFDWVCVSPKKFKKARPEVLMRADEIKVVVYHPSDIEFAMSFIPELRHDCKLYLQPEYSRFNKVMPLIVDHIKNHPKWSISLQTHKIMGVR